MAAVTTVIEVFVWTERTNLNGGTAVAQGFEFAYNQQPGPPHDRQLRDRDRGRRRALLMTRTLTRQLR